MPQDPKDNRPERRYPGRYERLVPIALALLLLLLIVLLVVTLIIVIGGAQP